MLESFFSYCSKDMSLSKKVFQTNDTKLTISSKTTALNPNAAEFVPLSLRSSSSPYGSTSNAADITAKFAASSGIGKAVLDRSESSVSNTSDDEAHQFWRHQLPDDITPDFKVMSEDEPKRLDRLSLVGLSLHDDGEVSRFPSSIGSGLLPTDQQEQSPRQINGNNFSEKLRYDSSSYQEDLTAANFLNLQRKPWDTQIGNSEQLLANERGVHPYNESTRHGFMNEILGEHSIMDDAEVNVLEYLASQFPGFAADSLEEVYYANGCDLNLTIDILSQLELQVDGGFNQNGNSKTLSAPNLNALDFPSLTVPDNQNGASKYAGHDPYRSSEKDNLLMFKSSASFPSRGSLDFASAVKKLASQNSGLWKYDKNGSADSVGSSRSSHVLAGGYSSGNVRDIYTDRLQNHGSGRAAPMWLETGQAVANMYSEMREEARDHARLRNAYFEQARQAYLIGNKALAKELGAKGQLHNIQMKAAHGKAQESIYRQRNPVAPEMQRTGRGHERMIDLHGLHVSEALHMLKHELSVLRSTARLADQRLQVYICVGTGHHTRGSRTPARLPIAVQRYLLEEEGLDYTEPHPGLLRVVIY